MIYQCPILSVIRNNLYNLKRFENAPWLAWVGASHRRKRTLEGLHRHRVALFQAVKLLGRWNEAWRNDLKTRESSSQVNPSLKPIFPQLKTKINTYGASQVYFLSFRFLALPYHIGWLYGRLQEPRRKNVETSKNYLITFLELMDQFNSED